MLDKVPYSTHPPPPNMHGNQLIFMHKHKADLSACSIDI
jgi:hypothetical protein